MAVVTRAVIFAAGRGTRLGALTAETPKPLLDVGGKPIVVHIIDGLIRAGITELVIITGYRAARLEAELGNGAGSAIAIDYVRQEQQDGTAHALLLARELLADEPFFWSWGDILVESLSYRRVLRAAALADGVLGVNDVDDPWAGAAVYVGANGRIGRIVEKPPKGTSRTRWNNAGFGVLGPEIWPEIERLEPSAAGEYELPRAIAALIAGGANIVAIPVEGPWFDIGTPEDLAAARMAYSKGRTP
ncbi:MAG: nucleotidyltransferase family protein [Chloroflexi bacterium]|nr:nucleotidyltransferase family protein [Chloroflexota bacterium]